MIASPYRCYDYTQEELAELGNGTEDRAICESRPGFVFRDLSEGEESLAPGCGPDCWCCQPSKIQSISL